MQVKVMAAASQRIVFKSSDSFDCSGSVSLSLSVPVHVRLRLTHLYVNKWAMLGTTAFISSAWLGLPRAGSHTQPSLASIQPYRQPAGLVYLPGQTWFQCLKQRIGES